MKLANWIKCLGDPTITVEEIQLCNRALSWTDLGHDNLDRLMRVYFNKTKFANQRKHRQPGVVCMYWLVVECRDVIEKDFAFFKKTLKTFVDNLGIYKMILTLPCCIGH